MLPSTVLLSEYNVLTNEMFKCFLTVCAILTAIRTVQSSNIGIECPLKVTNLTLPNSNDTSFIITYGALMYNTADTVCWRQHKIHETLHGHKGSRFYDIYSRNGNVLK